jgi:hypothetical protein
LRLRRFDTLFFVREIRRMNNRRRLDAALQRLDWSNLTLARRLGCDERNVRRWLDGASPTPLAVLEWLASVIAALDALPAPEWRVRKQPAAVAECNRSGRSPA